MKFKKTNSALLSLAMSAGLTANVLSTLYLNVNAETTTAKTDFLLGDVNGNGMVDAVDASSVLTYYAKTSTGKDGGFTEIQMKAADMNENGLVDATDASAILTYYAKSSVDNGGSSGTVELSNFKASVWDIYINTEETVKFTVDVTADEKLAEKAVALYDDSDKLVAYMNDDGKNGDEKANDGVYSVDVVLSSPEIKLSIYYAAVTDNKSNDFKLCFYRDMTEDEINSFIAFNDALKNITFEEASDYIKNSDEVIAYGIDEKSRKICYRTKYYITGIWEEPVEGVPTNGSGPLAFPVSEIKENDAGMTLHDKVVDIIKNSDITPVDHKKNKVIVLNGTMYETSDGDINRNSEKIGDCIDKVLNENSKLTVLNGKDVTLNVFKNLREYNTIIGDLHGYTVTMDDGWVLSSAINPLLGVAGIIPQSTLPPIGTNYICTNSEVSDIFELFPYFYPDCIGCDVIICNGKFAVGAGFFRNYYRYGDLEDSIWFLGSCHTMNNEDISDELLAKGADTVLAFSSKVTSDYVWETMFEILVNGMILSADTVGNSVTEAKKELGEKDPYMDERIASELCIRGNQDYRYIEDIKLKTSNTTTVPVATATTISTTVPVATATTITTTKAASEMQPDIFGEKVYSMPGNIAISFSPIDAGTNHDPRTLDIITKLYNELDDSDKATYHSYTGAVTFSFSPKYTTDKGVEVGEYSSLGDILNCARSIDDTFSFFMSNLEEGEDSSKTAWVECYNNDFDALSGKLIHREYSTREEKINEYAKKDNEKFNMYSAIFGNRSFLCEGRNDTIITIVKDDYYYYKWNSFTGVLTKYSARMWYNNYFVNHEHDYGGTMVHYVIDLRPKYDAALRDMCGESGGKYIQYSEENLDNLIKLINARRAYIDEYSRIQSEKWK